MASLASPAEGLEEAVQRLTLEVDDARHRQSVLMELLAQRRAHHHSTGAGDVDLEELVLRRVIQVVSDFEHGSSIHADDAGGDQDSGDEWGDEEEEEEAERLAPVIAVGASASHRTKGPCRVVFRGQTVLGPGLWYVQA